MAKKKSLSSTHKRRDTRIVPGNKKPGNKKPGNKKSLLSTHKRRDTRIGKG